MVSSSAVSGRQELNRRKKSRRRNMDAGVFAAGSSQHLVFAHQLQQLAIGIIR
ncbi:hypothetical protein D3C87_2209950 [compost metagenome]